MNNPLEESIQSKRQEIWTRMYDLLDLNPGGVTRGGRGRVLMAIRPTISTEALLRTAEIRKETKSQTAVGVVYHVVPEDERWMLYSYSALRQAGDRDVVNLTLGTPQALGTAVMHIDNFAAVGVRHHTFGQPLPILPGWTLRLQGSGGTTDGNWDLQVFIGIDRSWLT